MNEIERVTYLRRIGYEGKTEVSKECLEALMAVSYTHLAI